MTPDPDRAGSPGWLRFLLRRLLPRSEREHLLEEMERLYARRVEQKGRTGARLWYLRHALLFPVRLALEWVRGLPSRVAAGLEGMVRELRRSARRLRRRPSYSWTVVLTLGVGVGGLATVYNAANWVLLRPVPGVGQADGLVTIRFEQGGPGGPAFPVSAPDLRTLAEGAPALSLLTAAREMDVNLVGESGGTARRVTAAVAAGAYARVLRLRPTLGRFPGPDAPAGAVVISHRLWQRDWGGSPDVLGRTLRVNGHPFTLVGVAPPGFRGAELPGSFDLWFPAGALPILATDEPTDVLDRRDAARFNLLVGRLAPGSAPSVAAAQLQAGIDRIRAAHQRHSFYANFTVRAYEGVGLSPRVRDEVGRTLGLLAGAAGLLLLLAVTNVANLSLASALDRSGSTAVRIAMGAGRSTVIRGVLAEHLVLGSASAAAGLLAAVAATRALQGLDLSTLGAPLAGMRLDGRVAAFTFAAAAGAALLAALFPAAAALRSRRNLLAGLHGQRQGSRTTARTQTVMAAAQVALAAVLLVTAGLLIQTVLNLQSVDPGFPADAVRFAIDPEAQGYDDQRVADLLARLRDDLAGRTGRTAVGFAAPQPLSTSYFTFAVRGPDMAEDERPIVAAQMAVTDGFLEAMGARLLAGRPFDSREADPRNAVAREEGSDPVPVVVSESLTGRLFPDEPPEGAVGRLAHRWDGHPIRVIGVVADVRVLGPGTDPPPLVFLPWGAGGYGPPVGWVRGPDGPGRLAARVREAVQRADPTLPIFELRTVRAQLDRLIVEQTWSEHSRWPWP